MPRKETEEAKTSRELRELDRLIERDLYHVIAAEVGAEGEGFRISPWALDDPVRKAARELRKANAYRAYCRQAELSGLTPKPRAELEATIRADIERHPPWLWLRKNRLLSKLKVEGPEEKPEEPPVPLPVKRKVRRPDFGGGER